MAFEVTPEAYGRFMGQYSVPLAAKFMEVVAPRRGQRVLDVGCGTGILTSELVERLGPDAVSAIDPSAPFLAAVRESFPSVDIREGHAEELPFDDDSFDIAVAQLVVHHMADPVQGVREMARVTRPGGVVAATVWDVHDGGGPLSLFWQAAQTLDTRALTDSGLPDPEKSDLAKIFDAAGLGRLEPAPLTVHRWFATFDEWWDPYLLGVGPAGDLVARLDEAERATLMSRCRHLLPPAPFDVPGTAWCARATVPG